MHWITVALGGAAGAVSRFAITRVEQQFLLASIWPLATFTVNVLGSACIGFLYIVIVEQQAISQEWRYPLMAGFFGAFTTFSTFALESVTLMENGRAGLALAYIGASVLTCLLGCWLGLSLGRLIAS